MSVNAFVFFAQLLALNLKVTLPFASLICFVLQHILWLSLFCYSDFDLSAHSKSHSFNAKGMNFSHSVSSLSFGSAGFQPLSRSKRKRLPPQLRTDLPSEPNSKTTPLLDTFISESVHQVHEHYLKVIPTSYVFLDGSSFDSYQYTVNSHHYVSDDNLPAAIFSYNLAPTQVCKMVWLRCVLALTQISICWLSHLVIRSLEHLCSGC